MATERIIHIHQLYAEAGEHDHPSLASHRRREEEAKNKQWEHEQEDLVYLEKRYGFVQGDQLMPYEWEHLQEVRAELKECAE